MLLINNADVMKVLDMELTLEALDRVFHEMVNGDATGMGRIDLYVPLRTSVGSPITAGR